LNLPIMNPSRPIQAEMRCTVGDSSIPESFAPSFGRRQIMVNRMKKIIENPSETAIKAGVVAVGADKRLGALPGRSERSRAGLELGEGRLTGHGLYVGFNTGDVQMRSEWPFGLAHEPAGAGG
jgi:hypothetical protein